MNRNESHELGRWLVENIRDRCVSEIDRLIDGRVRGAKGEAWRAVVESDEASAALRKLAPDIVDSVLFELLYKVDEGALDLMITDPVSLKTVDSGRGEYAGWFEGADGWRHWYANERFNDYYSDLD